MMRGPEKDSKYKEEKQSEQQQKEKHEKGGWGDGIKIER